MKHMKTLSSAAILACGVMVAGDAFARPNFPGSLPNGSEKNCLTCHTRPQGGGGTRNALGTQVQMNLDNRLPDWSALFSLDADLDGYTNGQEMGDPNGMFPGMEAGDYLSDPASMSETPCGNGQIDPKGAGMEECDGVDVGGATCADFGGDAGRTPMCTPSCTIDMSSCSDMPPMDMGMMEMDMGMPPADMGMPPADMGTPPADMGSDTPADMGSDANNGSNNDTGNNDDGPDDDGDDDDDDARCSQVAPGAPTGSWIAILGLAALGLIRRRRR